MIELIFELGSEVILVVIKGNKVTFGNTAYGNQMADISGLKLNYDGVCREFPDLELEDDWREQACERFKSKIEDMKNEEEVCKYIIGELESQGYKAKKKMREGFRAIDL
tara:strand:- start:1592 stop:1918 length:327 start_codon:yes stop_codon:yes gene_type:complete